MSKFILLHVSQSSKITVQKNIKKKWIYLGKNSTTRNEWQRLLGKENRISLENLLVRTAWDLRGPYANWVANIGKSFGNSMRWWSSDIAEKNTGTSNLFLHICYLQVVLKEFEKHDELLVVVEDWALYIDIKQNLRELGVDFCQPHSPVFLIWGILKEIALFTGRFGKQLFSVLHKITAARLSRKYNFRALNLCKTKRVLIHTCIDESCLGEDGIFRDRYFSVFPEWLEKNGYDVVTIVWLYNVKRSLSNAFRWFRTAKGNFIIPEDYFRFRDFPGAIFFVLGQFFVPFGDRDFEGHKISCLLLRERCWQASNVSKIRFLFYKRMIKSLKFDRQKIDYYIDKFENMWTEKPAASAVHNYFPDAKVVGFQHASVNPFMLKYMMLENEREIAPEVFPDIIFCNGSAFKDVLVKNGFNENILAVGPALRYQYLWKKDLKKSETKSRKIILLVLPLAPITGAEVLKKFINATMNISCRKIIKLHPMAKKEKILSLIDRKELPSQFVWGEGNLNDWLPKAYCVVGMATAALFEAIIFGVPIAIIGLEGELEMNPLAWWQEKISMFQAIYDIGQLQQKVEFYLNVSEKELEDILHPTRKLLKSALSPWQEESLTKIWPKIN